MKRSLLRSLLLLLFALVAGVSLHAVPARRGLWKMLTLADGSRVRAELRGDEFGHYYVTADGRTLTFDATSQTYAYASIASLVQQAQAKRAQRHVRLHNRGMRRAFGQPTHYSGEKKSLIILVNFKDVKLNDKRTKAFYNRVANEENFSEAPFKASVYDYFKAMSRGKFHLKFDVVGPITLSNNRSYYGGNVNGEAGQDRNAVAMAREACNAVKDSVNFADYDWDGDGEVDQVFVLYAGQNEADGGPAESVWPHEWSFSGSGSSKLTLDGVKVDTYACSSELQTSEYGGTKVAGIGVICHEFSHCLGFPDMYDVDYEQNGQGYGMSFWDLMDAGAYLDEGFTPAGYTAYERWFASWLTPVEITDEMEVHGLKGLENDGQAYIIYNAANRNEYYILENRQKKGFDSELYTDDGGLLITHVYYQSDLWSSNSINIDSDNQYCTVVPADNNFDMSSFEDIAGDLFPYNGRTELSNGSTPAATLFNENSDGNKFLNFHISDITLAEDGSISFNVKPSSEVPDKHYGFFESFDKCDGKGGNDKTWGGSGIGNGSFSPDNEGWEKSESVSGNLFFGGKQCARLGSSTLAGNVLSPVFELNGETTISFKVASWKGSKTCSLTVDLLDDGNNLQKRMVDSEELPSEEWTTYTFTVDRKGLTRLRFTPSGEKRIFLDEVRATVVQPAVNTGVKMLQASSTVRQSGVYSLQGTYLGTSLQHLPHGVYIVNGRKVVH